MKVHYPLHRRVFAGLLLAAACSLPSTLHAQAADHVAPAALLTQATLPSPLPVPVVIGFTPVSGPPGTQVTVSGGNFYAITGVTIAGHPASFTVNSPNKLIAIVPNVPPACGPIRVTNSAGTGQSPDIFAITPAGGGPVICNFSPSSGKAGDSITLRGGNFDNVQEVIFNCTKAVSFGVPGLNFLTATVPAGATTGRIRVVTASGSATSPTDFVVTGSSAVNLTVTPASLSFEAAPGRAISLSQILAIGSTGAALNWTVSDNAPWLTLSPVSGTTPGSTTASVSVNSPGLAAGTYKAVITVTASCAGNSPVTVPVTLTVSSL